MARPRKHDKWLKLAEKNGIKSNLYHARLALGWSQERAATEVVRGRGALTDEEKAYICKFYEVDGPTMIGYALNKKSQVISALYSKYKKQGLVEYYKRMWDKQFQDVEASGWF